MTQWLTIDEVERPVIRQQMERAYRGCRFAALLLVLTLLLLIGGTLLTILPVEEPTADSQSPLQTLGLVLLILGCMCAAAEVVLVIITIVFLKNVKTCHKYDLPPSVTRSVRTDAFRPQFITVYSETTDKLPVTAVGNDYKYMDFKYSVFGEQSAKDCPLL